MVEDTAYHLSHVATLGLTVNSGKSCLVPSQQVAYLGLVLDSVAMSACLSPRRVSDILQLLPRFRSGRRLPACSVRPPASREWVKPLLLILMLQPLSDDRSSF